MAEPLLAPPARNWQPYVAILLSCLVSLVPPTQCTGSLNAFGTFSVYYASYYYQSSPESPLVQNCFFVIFPLTCILEGVAFGEVQTGFSIYLYQHWGLRLTLALSGALFSGAFLSVYLISSPIVFVVIYGTGVGFGAGGCVYLCALECWKHFSGAKGIILGLLNSCYGLSPALFGLLFAFLCNPENSEPTIKVHTGETEYNLFPDPVAGRVPRVSFLIGLVYASLFLIAVLFFPVKPEDQPMSVTESIASVTSLKRKTVGRECPSLGVAVRTWAFWSLTINMFCGITYGVFLVNVYKNYGMTYYKDDQLLSTIGSSSALLSAVGKVLSSGAMDVLSFKQVYGCNIAIQLAISATITLILPVSIYLYWVWTALSFFVFAGVFPAFILESAEVFGTK